MQGALQIRAGPQFLYGPSAAAIFIFFIMAPIAGSGIEVGIDMQATDLIQWEHRGV